MTTIEPTSTPAASGAALTARYEQVMMNTFGPPKRVFVRGEGVHVWDADGREYLDLLAGIAVNALGHAHPQVLGAISSQLSTLGHVSNFFATPTQVALAERLAAIVTGDAPGARRVRLDPVSALAPPVPAPSVPPSTPVVPPSTPVVPSAPPATVPQARVFFANSGTEANEAAFKLSRRTGRKKIIAMEGAFHGRTMGALALTHHAAYREPFEPLPGVVEFVPYGDAAALEAALDDTVAAVVIEPIQGENGVIEPPDDYLAAARRLTSEVGALLWFDEVQTGMGRCGDWLASDASGVTADVVTLAKGLGNGFPIGACVATGKAADLLQPGMHGTTFGGNPVAAAAGLAVCSIIERDGLLAHVRETGRWLADAIMGLGLPEVEAVRGRGLLRGVVLREPIAAEVAQAALDAGFVVNAPRPNVLRLAPPLIVTTDQLRPFTDALPGLLAKAVAKSGRDARAASESAEHVASTSTPCHHRPTESGSCDCAQDDGGGCSGAQDDSTQPPEAR